MADKVTAELLALKSRLDNANPRYYGGSTRIDILPEDHGALVALIEAAITGKSAEDGVIRVLAVAPEKCDCGFCDGLLYLNRASYCCDKHSSVEFHIDYCEANALSTTEEPKR